MGGALSYFKHGAPIDVLLTGLDHAGKTTVGYRLNRFEIERAGAEHIPSTVSLSLPRWNTFASGGLTLHDLDLPAQPRLLNVMARVSRGLVFVVDSAGDVMTGVVTAPHRLPALNDVVNAYWEEASASLRRAISALRAERQAPLPIVVVAAKQELPGAATPSTVAARLGLGGLQCPVRVVGFTMRSPMEDIVAAMAWLKQQCKASPA